jgi:hypothetical protein
MKSKLLQMVFASQISFWNDFQEHLGPIEGGV